MKWYRLAFGAPLSDNQPMLDSPDIVDRARDGKPGLGVAPSPYNKHKPGAPEGRRKKRRKHKRRTPYPRPDLSETPKKPEATTDRPDGDLFF